MRFLWIGCDCSVCRNSNRRRIAGAIRYLVKARGPQLECTMILHETLIVSVLMYGSETMIRKEKKRSRIRVVQIDNLRGLLGIRRMDNARNDDNECMDKGVVRSDERGGRKD